MGEDEKLVILREMTGERDVKVLSAYLRLAARSVLDQLSPYKILEEIPERYDGVHIEIAAYLLNKRGAEGEVSHSENGVSRTYESGGIPASLLRRITPFAEVVG